MARTSAGNADGTLDFGAVSHIYSDILSSIGGAADELLQNSRPVEIEDSDESADLDNSVLVFGEKSTMAEGGNQRDGVSVASSATSVFHGIDRALAKHLDDVKIGLEGDLDNLVKAYKNLKKKGRRQETLTKRVEVMEKFQDLVKRLKEWRVEYERAGLQDFSLEPDVSKKRARRFLRSLKERLELIDYMHDPNDVTKPETEAYKRERLALLAELYPEDVANKPPMGRRSVLSVFGAAASAVSGAVGDAISAASSPRKAAPREGTPKAVEPPQHSSTPLEKVQEYVNGLEPR